MRGCGLPLPAIALVFTVTVIAIGKCEDIYWEGEDDASNEFLEAKDERTADIGHILHRFRRGFFDFLGFSTPEPDKDPKPAPIESNNEPVDNTLDKDDEDFDTFGSGFIPEREPEPKEKTLRVSFLVMEPYQEQYSNRDSVEFRNFSKSIADAVNVLYESLPGTQRASLVRIQSLVDDFKCKVTLDIVSTGYEDTGRITQILRDHIKNRANLGSVTVSDSDFSASIIDPGAVLPECPSDEWRCEDGHCVPGSARCDGLSDCADKSDEHGCSATDDIRHSQNQNVDSKTTTLPPLPTPEIGEDENTEYETETPSEACVDTIQCLNTLQFICKEKVCDGVKDCPYGDDERSCDLETETRDCVEGEFICDFTRCVRQSKKCDGYNDCDDGSDEIGCNSEHCGGDDFRCNNGKCIDSFRRCDGVVDCSTAEDEQRCECRPDQFQCKIDGSCIAGRMKCDGQPNCRDNSDEMDCPVNPSCPEGLYQCNNGSCVEGCNGVPECSDGADEEDCEQECAMECDGHCLDSSQICDTNPDCSDGADELHCDACDRFNDFRCQNGECLSAHQKCNNVVECSDGSDEIDCEGIISPVPQGCNENQFQCRDGLCIDKEFLCDRHRDCNDNSDEENCAGDTNSRCDEFEWQCTNGNCIPQIALCDGRYDCYDRSDEQNCATNAPFPPDDSINYLTTTAPRPYTTAAPYFTTTGSPYWTSPPWKPQQPQPQQPSRGPVALNLKSYPEDQTVRYGGDVVFQCRDEGPQRAPVRWIREGGRPLKPGSVDRKGRLEIIGVSVSDSGVYVCQAPAFLGYPSAELRVTLHVNPQAPPTPRRITCQEYEATCRNGQCIPKTAVCDGKPDCSDRSDEDECDNNEQCEPNQFRCPNRSIRTCILKTWLCDSEDDCGDGSDEQNCVATEPGQPCLPAEFSCRSKNQCIPKAFHCDGQIDCLDLSDESDCRPVNITRPPQPQNVRLNPGEVLVLRCEAMGMPVPLITWRLNWGHVPPKCISTSIQGVGVLTCPNMQPEDSGAYSCEAINNRNTVFAVPDSIVYVNRTQQVCPPGFFNSEAHSPNECIRCFCFGESTQCKSADLYTYNMPTPLGEGGTMLVGVSSTFTGTVQVDSRPITDLYYYQPLRNGAAVTKLETFASRSSHPYVSLPESYNGNQLTSYGGRIRYEVRPHSDRNTYGNNNVPEIIVIGKHGTLVHMTQPSRRYTDFLIEVPFLPGSWQKVSARGPIPATREDIMMALDNVDMILLRADQNGAGSNISDFTMESAQHINAGLGAASLVEECQCPPGYEGLSCQKCGDGYERQKSGPWLGNCVKEEKPCPPGTYGDPSSGYACRPCPCPMTNRENQFARTCSLGASGRVICDCMPGYEGANCESCAPGYVGNPLISGDSCRPKPSDNCNPIGTLRVRLPDQCECKDNVRGRYCDQCNEGSFFLSQDFRHGCAQCFCTGVTQQCSSSNLRRRTSTIVFNVPQLVEQVRVYNSAPVGPLGNIRYNAPTETDLTPIFYKGEISLSSYDRSKPSIYYWSLPATFAGDKVTAYGGHLTYTLRHILILGGSASTTNSAPDVQLISENHLTFHYFGNFAPSSDGLINGSVPLLEGGWQRPDGKEVQREHLLLALADVKTILVKATYTSNAQVASLISASIDTAETYGDGPQALHVEQCVCPTGYLGTSCEDCAPGFTRSGSGLYLEHCEPCDCNNKSRSCHPETGICLDCADNTSGDNCEQCKPGYERDRYNNCVRSYGPRPPYDCSCDPRGEARPCDSGRCICKQNVEGESCDRCRLGTFGLDQSNPDGCLRCYCSGVTNDCHEATHYTRIPIPAPIFGENYGGYTLMDLNAQRVINDQIVPATNESELMYIFSFAPSEELYWSLPVFPGSRILSYGGSLALTQKFETGGYPAESQPGVDVVLGGDGVTLFWSNPRSLHSGVPLTYQVPLKENGWYLLNSNTPATRDNFMDVLKNLRRVLVRATLSRSIVSTAIADVSMDTATENFSNVPAKGIEVCQCPTGYTGTSCESCSSTFYRDIRGQCRACSCNGHECQLGPYGDVVCQCRPPYTGANCSSLVGESSLNDTNRPPPPKGTIVVRITSPTIKVLEVGGTVNFTCEARSRLSRGPITFSWYKADGYLPQGRHYVDDNNSLMITNAQVSDSGRYVCQASDGVSTEQDYATLQVPGNDMTTPTIQIRPQTYNVYFEGDYIELECDAQGNPTPRISWSRSPNRPLPINVEISENRLVIERATEADSGEYRCKATNDAGSVDRIAVITVRPRPSSPPRERLTITPTSVTMNEAQTTRIVCSGTNNIQPGSIGWSRQDGTAILSNIQSSNGVLFIEGARLDNQGVYICQTSSPDVPPVSILITIVPLAKEPPPPEVYNVTVQVRRIKIPTGGNGIIDCIPIGYPLPTIKWKKHQGEFGPGTSQRENSLIISNAQEIDQGYYMCEGLINNSPVAYDYADVVIEKREPPRIEIWPQGEQAVPLGSQFEFHCRVLGGVPEPDVMWDRNGGRPLSPYTQILPRNILKFEKIEVNDEGEYTCTATNVAGYASASAVLKVRSPPEISVPSSVIVVRGDPINVECRASGYPEPLVSIRQESPSYREVAPPSPGIAVFRVSSATERDEGTYTCSATSAAGTMDDMFAVTVERGDGGFPDPEGSGDQTDDNYEQLGQAPDEPNALYAIEGQNAVIGCNSSGNNIVRWSRGNGQPLQPSARQIENKLIITRASQLDAGYYECSQLDRYTGEVQQSLFTRLDVMRAPSITLNPPTQTVLPGQSPTVDCVVDGDQILEVTWRPRTRPFSRRVEVRDSLLIFNQIEIEDAGSYECFAKNKVANATSLAEVIVTGPRNNEVGLVAIDQPRRPFRVRENVNVLCKSNHRDTKVEWERLGSKQFLETRTYGDGSILIIRGVEESDTGVYRCTGRDVLGRTSYEDLNLEVEPGPESRPPPPSDEHNVYTARLKSAVDLPCTHNLQPPVSIEWRREYLPFSPEVRTNEPILHLPHVTEADAGVYLCRVSNNRAADVVARAVLRVSGVVPRFNGESWLSLPTLKDAFRKFDIEVSLKPMDSNGLILYNSENQGREGDYLALQLEEGVPKFTVEIGTGPVVVLGDRPLSLNAWHTIRIGWDGTKVTMDVDNTGPFITKSPSEWVPLDLKQPMYIGGVPDYEQLPPDLSGTPGFAGCVSMLVLGREEKDIMSESYEQYNTEDCDSCSPNHCLNNGVCQEAHNERGYTCLCANGFAGLDCDRTGSDACRPGICGPGKCNDTADGFKCICPVPYSGQRCENKQSIEYPAFMGRSYLATNVPPNSRYFRVSLKLMAYAPVADGLIIYGAESTKVDYGGFTSLAVKDGNLEFRYDLGDENGPVILRSSKPLKPYELTDVHLSRVGTAVSMKINMIETVNGTVASQRNVLKLEPPLYIGGYDESLVLNRNTGVSGGFRGCIRDVLVFDVPIHFHNTSIHSSNVQECSYGTDRGDIPEVDVCAQCRNGGYCRSADATACTCPAGYTGAYCESRVSFMRATPQTPCDAAPCRNGGTCRPHPNNPNNYSCDCLLGFAGTNCQMRLDLYQTVGFNGNGYLELPAHLIRYDQSPSEPTLIAFAVQTEGDGVLFYQRESNAARGRGDYLLLRVEDGKVVMEWDVGSGPEVLRVDDVTVTDGDRHIIIAKLYNNRRASLEVDWRIREGETSGFGNVMNADSNIYIGGIPEALNVNRYPGLSGCFDQVELMNLGRALPLGELAVAARNTQRCREP